MGFESAGRNQRKARLAHARKKKYRQSEQAPLPGTRPCADSWVLRHCVVLCLQQTSLGRTAIRAEAHCRRFRRSGTAWPPRPWRTHWGVSYFTVYKSYKCSQEWNNALTWIQTLILPFENYAWFNCARNLSRNFLWSPGRLWDDWGVTRKLMEQLIRKALFLRA